VAFQEHYSETQDNLQGFGDTQEIISLKTHYDISGYSCPPSIFYCNIFIMSISRLVFA